jgi:hypothetical protein
MLSLLKRLVYREELSGGKYRRLFDTLQRHIIIRPTTEYGGDRHINKLNTTLGDHFVAKNRFPSDGAMRLPYLH